MATDPLIDPIDAEAERVFADPGVQARIREYLERESKGKLGPGLTTEEVVAKLGLQMPDVDSEDRH